MNSFKLLLAAQFLLASAMHELHSTTTPPAQQAGAEASKI
jgi:hypothetical protein